MDKSFEGLLFSIILHVLLVVLLWNAKVQPSAPRPTEITLIEKSEEPKTKAHQIINETAKKNMDDRPKEPADFLSQFTNRVKKQVRAKMIGPTVNASPKPATQQQEEKRKRVAGLQQNEKDPDVQSGTLNQNNEAIRNVVIGQSAIQDNIRGVEGASFTALNTDQFTFYTFFARLGQQMGNRWVAGLRGYGGRLSNQQLERLATRDRTTVVEILLTPDGQFSKSIVQRSSGDEGLDDVAVQAFREAAPFPNPPREMIERDGFVHIHYALTVLMRPPSFGAG